MTMRRCYCEPNDACNPDKNYCLVAFSNLDHVETYRIQKSMFMIGSIKQNDVQIEKCERQHAVIQFRNIKPYIFDINSVDGTYVNDIRIETLRYFELKPEDVVQFGACDLEYVFMIE